MKREIWDSRNRLLGSILEDCPMLRPHLQSVSFPVGHQICMAGRTLSHVYFPIAGVLSTLIELRAGGSAETLTVGNEGMVGISVWLGIRPSLEQVLQQATGEIAQVAAGKFCEAIAGHQRTERLLKRFTAYSLRFSSQNTACGTRHDATQRMCRWLLISADRVGIGRLNLTHSLLANMVGARRQTVGDIAVRLQRDGLIHCRRSDIQIIDRKGVAARACECYVEMNEQYEQLVDGALSR